MKQIMGHMKWKKEKAEMKDKRGERQEDVKKEIKIIITLEGVKWSMESVKSEFSTFFECVLFSFMSLIVIDVHLLTMQIL